MSNESLPICPQCGAVLKASAPAGLCPNCLMALNLKTETVFTDHTPAAQPPLPPEQLAPHFPQLEILECLGRGGMGVVYKARQKTLNRLVALKLLAPERVGDAKFAERFTREAQALAALNHPNIVTIHDFGQAGGFYFLLMEFVDGVNLRQLLRARKFTPEEALAIVPPLCDALQFAHDRGVIHRDIKPENLLLDKAGRVKVADFGIAKMLSADGGAGSPLHADSQQSEAGAHGVTRPAAEPSALTGEQTVGTPGYSAPEQKTDPQRVDSRADIYSLGVVFYEMLTGELPGKRLEPPSRKVQIDVRLDEVVLRALEKNPELRYQQVSEVKTAVETIQTRAPDDLRPTQAPSASWEAARTRVRPLATTLIVLGTLGLIISMLVQVRGFSSDSLHFSLGAFGYWRLFLPANCAAFLATVEPLLRILNLVVLVGALRMRQLQSYWLAIAGAASAMVTPPLLPIGLPVGAGALLVLARRDVRREFGILGFAGTTSPSGAAPSFSRLAVLSAVLAAISLLELWLEAGIGLLGVRPRGDDSSGWGWSAIMTVVLWIPHWGFWGTVFLAGVALEDIRQATGRLKGAGIATFALLFMPLYWVLTHAFRLMAEPIETPADFTAIAFLASTVALVLCGGFAVGMHRNEVRRAVAALADPSDAGRLLPKWVVRTLQSAATVLVVLELCLGGFITYLTQSWTGLSAATQIAFYSHAHAEFHPKPGRESDSKRFSATLPGGEVALVAVSDLSSPSPVCWRPDGALLCRATNALTGSFGKQTRPRFLALSLDLADSLTGGRILPFELRVAGKPVASRHWSTSARGTFVFFAAPPEASLLDFRLGEPAGEWLDTDAGWEWNGEIPRHPERVIRRSGQQAIVALGRVKKLPDDGTSVDWTRRSFPKDWVGRVVAVDGSGVVHEPVPATTSLKDVMAWGWQGQSETFSNLPPARVKELRLQIRNCQWAEFRNVSLELDHRTSVEVQDAVGAKAASGRSPIEQGGSATKNVSAATPPLLSEPPKLRFLAWQDEWKTNQPGAARHPDGSPVTDPTELKWLGQVHPAGMDLSSLKLPSEPRFLHLWFSHPDFGRLGLNEVSLLDATGNPITLGGQGSISGGAHGPSESNGNLGWITKTLSPAEGTNIPPRVTVRFRYTAGPLERIQKLPVTPRNKTVMSLEGGSELNGVGQDVDGRAFVAIAVDVKSMPTRQFDVVAVAHDGREIRSAGGGSSGAVGAGFRVENFDFELSLADVAKFIIGTRPIRTVEWKDVVLPVDKGGGSD